MTPQPNPKRDERIRVRVDADIADLIPGFLEDRQRDITAMLEAVEEHHYETVRLLGHRMKGCGGSYGFDAITEIGGALEQAANDKNSEKIRHWVGELASYLDRVDVVYDSGT